MVDHSLIFRWVQRYAPESEKRVARDPALESKGPGIRDAAPTKTG